MYHCQKATLENLKRVRKHSLCEIADELEKEGRENENVMATTGIILRKFMVICFLVNI